MPHNSNEEKQLKIWKNRIAWSRHSAMGLHQGWERAVKLFEARKENEQDIKVPFLFSTFSTRLPALFSTMPKIAAIPKTPGDIDNANLVEKIVEDIADRTDFHNEIFQAVYSSVLLGVGFVKLGFSSDIEEIPSFSNGILSLMEVFPFTSARAEKSFREQETLTKEIVTNETVWVDYVKATDIFLDPEAEKFESCKFVIHRILLSRDEFKERFGNTRVSGVKRVNIDAKAGLAKYLEEQDTERYELFEVWDKLNRKRLVVAEGCDKFLEYEDWPHKLLDYPFEVLSLTPKLDSIYGINELLLLEDASHIINDMTAIQEDNAQRAQNGLMYDEGAMDDEQAGEFFDAGNKKAVKVRDVSRITSYQTPPVPSETYRVKADMERQITETAHISANIRQSTVQGKQTATEIQTTVNAGNVLTQFKVRRIEMFIERIVRKLIALVKQYYEYPQIVKVDGALGSPSSFIEWVGSDIGEYTFEVKAGSAAFKDESLKLQQTMQFFGQIMGLVGSPALSNPAPLIQELLVKIGDMQGINSAIIRQAFSDPTSQMNGSLPSQHGGPVPVLSPEQTSMNIKTPNIATPTVNNKRGL